MILEEEVSVFKCVYLIVLDLVGIGEVLDVEKFGDVGSDILGYIVKEVGLIIFYLEKFGLGIIVFLIGVKVVVDYDGYVIKLEEIFVGKDIMIGYWEIMGLNIKKFFWVFLNGFFEELLK